MPIITVKAHPLGDYTTTRDLSGTGSSVSFAVDAEVKTSEDITAPL